jgi:hypothetical protein
MAGKLINGTIFYGPKGRLVSGVAAFAGVFAAAVAAAQQANLFSLFPQKYAPYVIAAPIISLFFTSFAERIQGGASKQSVRIAAQISDNKNEIEATNQ